MKDSAQPTLPQPESRGYWVFISAAVIVSVAVATSWNLTHGDGDENMRFARLISKEFPIGTPIQIVDSKLILGGFKRRKNDYSFEQLPLLKESGMGVEYDYYTDINWIIGISISYIFHGNKGFCGPKAWIVYATTDSNGNIYRIDGRYGRMTCMSY